MHADNKKKVSRDVRDTRGKSRATAGRPTIMPKPISPAAAALIAEHNLELAPLLDASRDEPFLSVRVVKEAIASKAQKAEKEQRQALIMQMEHNELRAELKACGIRNSFDGSTTDYIKSLLCSDRPPQQLHRTQALRNLREKEYRTLLQGVTLKKLATVCLPDVLWQDYQQRGWLQVNLELTRHEKRMIALCHRLALCELGVDPTNRATWENARHTCGYDSTWGWLRDPGNSLAQLYLATHPKAYRLYVGLYARLLIKCREQHRTFPPGVASEAEAVRACVELRLQLYNTKLALPRVSDGTGSNDAAFSHLDCDWKRAGCLETPAPQAFVATSPQQVEGKTVFSARFVDVEAKVAKYHKKRKRELRQYEQDVSSGNPPKQQTVDKKPYALPRKFAGDVVGTAVREPVGTDFSGERSSGPDNLQIGDMVMFGHLTAHKFVQHATVSAVSAGADDPTNATNTVPLGFTRTSEYPTLVAPWIHGVPHQSKEEILHCLLTGTPPRRWSHVYTGNTIPCNELFTRPIPPLQSVPTTPLSRVLVGMDEFRHCPYAIDWLLASCSAPKPEDSLLLAEDQTVEQHKRMMLGDMIASVRRRLRRLAEGKDTDLLRQAETDPQRSSYAQRSPLASSSTHGVPLAARAVLADTSLQSASKRRKLLKGRRSTAE